MDGAVHPARNDLVYAYDTAATHRILVSSFSIAAADLLDLALSSALVAHPASGLCGPSGESTGGASYPPKPMDNGDQYTLHIVVWYTPGLLAGAPSFSWPSTDRYLA